MNDSNLAVLLNLIDRNNALKAQAEAMDAAKEQAADRFNRLGAEAIMPALLQVAAVFREREPAFDPHVTGSPFPGCSPSLTVTVRGVHWTIRFRLLRESAVVSVEGLTETSPGTWAQTLVPRDLLLEEVTFDRIQTTVVKWLDMVVVPAVEIDGR